MPSRRHSRFFHNLNPIQSPSQFRAPYQPRVEAFPTSHQHAGDELIALGQFELHSYVGPAQCLHSYLFLQSKQVGNFPRSGPVRTKSGVPILVVQSTCHSAQTKNLL